MKCEKNKDTVNISGDMWISPEEYAFWVTLSVKWKMSLEDTVSNLLSVSYDHSLATGKNNFSKYFYYAKDGMVRIKKEPPFTNVPFSVLENSLKNKISKRFKRTRNLVKKSKLGEKHE